MVDATPKSAARDRFRGSVAIDAGVETNPKFMFFTAILQGKLEKILKKDCSVRRIF